MTRDSTRRQWVTTSDGGRIAAWVVGSPDACPVVLVAGAGGDHRGWRFLVPELCSSEGERLLLAPSSASLAASARVAVFDQRGIGESRDTPPAADAETTASDAVAVGRALLGERFGVVGASMGGMAALVAALDYPDAVRALGLLATTAGGVGLTWPTDAFIEHAAAPPGRTDQEQAREGVALSVSRRFRIEQPRLFEALVDDARAGSTSVELLEAQASVFMNHDVVDRLGEISVPTLVMCGTEDQAHPLPNSEFLAARISGARLVVLDHVGHRLDVEVPDRVSGELQALLAR